MNIQNQNKLIFHVNGMHCKSCVLVTESELGKAPNVKWVKSSLSNHTVEIEGDFSDKSQEEIAQDLSKFIADHGYSLSLEKKSKTKKWADFRLAIPFALVFMAVFIILQKMGIVNLVNTQEMTYGTAFVIGIIASLSTCMAVVGGLLLSMSATFAKEGDKIKPQVLFHVGRIISFFVLGGAIGSIGSVFALNVSAMFILSLIVGLVMLVLGINLLDIFDWTKKIQPSMPKFLSKHALGISKWNHTLTPFLVGIATFFLPCGFTQSMQIYTLSTGGFIQGGLTMLLFALGTLPILSLISFSSFSIKNSSKSGVFFKTAGLIVIVFALLNIVGSFVSVGIIPPILNL